MSRDNDLIASEADRPLSTEGLGVVDSAVQWADSVDDLYLDLSGDSWVDFALSSGVLALDAVATYSDPIGSLISAGLGFLLEHIKPFSDWFDELAGDPEAVAALAATWRNIGTEVGSIRFGLEADRQRRMADMEGPGVQAYLKASKALALKLHVVYKGSAGSADAYEALSELVDLVHDLIRDCLCDIVGSIISYATELALTLGAATPLVIEQASTRVASLSAKVGPQVTGVVRSGRSLADKLDELKSILDDMPRWFLDGAPPVPLNPAGRHAPRTSDEAVELAVNGWRRGMPDLLRGVGMKTTADNLKNLNEDPDE